MPAYPFLPHAAPRRHGVAAVVCLLLVAAALVDRVPAQAGSPLAQEAPVALSVSAETDESGARVTLTFTRQVEYRLEESRFRLTLLLPVSLDESSRFDRQVDGGTLRRIRVIPSERGSEVLFHLGREFETFSSVEMTEPFRVVLQFQRKGAPGATPAPPAAADASVQQEPPTTGPPAPPDGALVVVLDPGHGGSEDGAMGAGGLKEKDLVLDIAARLRTHLGRSGYTVLLTREDDSALDLTRRTATANHAGAGLFLSIHANASSRGAARGAETYYLSYGEVADHEAMSVASEENQPGLPVATQDEPGGGEIRMILWEMAQAEHLLLSSRLAGLIQGELNALDGTQDRGVKQAPFRVLVGATMPAVLVEVGFLSNPDEEKRLATQEYREQLASALASAIERFQREKGRRDEGGAPALSDGGPR